MANSPISEFTFAAALTVDPEPRDSSVATIAVWSAGLATLAILLFDLTAGLGAAGVAVGAGPVASALAIAPCYVALVAMLHREAPERRRAWTIMSLAFAVLYAGLVSFNYALQLTVVPQNPVAFANWTLALKPDSAFWALEVMGYAYMGLSALALVPALRETRARRIAGWLFVVNAVASALGGAAYLISGDPGNWLAVASLLVWGVAFPIGTGLIGWDVWRGRVLLPD